MATLGRPFARLEKEKVDGVDGDLEAGWAPLHPGLSRTESDLRWGFVRKVYGILATQILLTTAVSAATVLHPSINSALAASPGLALAFAILPLVRKRDEENGALKDSGRGKMKVEEGRCAKATRVGSGGCIILVLQVLYDGSVVDVDTLLLCYSSNGSFLLPLYHYRQRHPLNLAFLGLFTLCLSLSIGVACANTEGKIVLEALILTSAVVSSLTGYTFWASRKGKDFSYIGPFLFSGLIILLVTSTIQIFFPLGTTSSAIIGGFGALVFSGFIIYDTEELIKRYTYDEYIWASVNLYLDILNLFITILNMLKRSEN
ncbi:hypothetical protein ZIOFF_019009 [Zingiber officinale]|uniref:BI1-like protein n=1 Tax=Zingiber officinale TaxID=94328 RepID=A0A8J5HDN4_ZINOF|nr:hypothetical protein ZIOFF_019009 [Zingiber officinale]